jgi:gas vesicle protein
MSYTSPFNFDNRSTDSMPEMPAATGLAVLLIGAAVGLAAGLLIAPKSGRDLRADLLSKAGNWKTVAADAIAQGRDRLIDSVEATRKPTI